MPPGGTKRVRATLGSDIVPGVSIRSGKKYSTNFQQDSAEDQLNPQPENNDTAPCGASQRRRSSLKSCSGLVYF